MTLEEESEQATSLLKGKVVESVLRFRDSEIVIEFKDGTRLYADSKSAVELSVVQK